MNSRDITLKLIQTGTTKKFIVQVLFYPRRMDFATISGKNGDAFPLFLIISLTIVEATDVYLGSQVKKKVSMPGSRVLFASAIVFSYSKSLT